MARSVLDDHGSIAEDIIFILRKEHRLAVLQCAEVGGFGARRRRLGEHDVAFGLGREPGRARKEIGVPNVIPMKVRKRQVVDIGRRVTGFGELRCQGLGSDSVAQRSRTAAGREAAVRDRAHVPHQITLRVSDQKAFHRHLGSGYFFLLEPVA